MCKSSVVYNGTCVYDYYAFRGQLWTPLRLSHEPMAVASDTGAADLAFSPLWIRADAHRGRFEGRLVARARHRAISNVISLGEGPELTQYQFQRILLVRQKMLTLHVDARAQLSLFHQHRRLRRADCDFLRVSGPPSTSNIKALSFWIVCGGIEQNVSCAHPVIAGALYLQARRSSTRRGRCRTRPRKCVPSASSWRTWSSGSHARRGAGRRYLRAWVRVGV